MTRHAEAVELRATHNPMPHNEGRIAEHWDMLHEIPKTGVGNTPFSVRFVICNPPDQTHL